MTKQEKVMKILTEIIPGDHLIHIMRASNPEVTEVSIYKESSGKVGMYLSGNDDFYCNNTPEEMEALQERIKKGIEISKNFDYYFDKFKEQ